MEKQGIHTVLRQNEAGLLYGITYVDHQTKCVFNGSCLGKQYSAKAIQERCLPENVLGQELLAHPAPKQGRGLQPHAAAAAETKVLQNDQQAASSKGTDNILDALMQPEAAPDYVPSQLKRNRKKRKRRNMNNNL